MSPQGARLRIVVLSNSTGYFIRPPRSRSDEGTYAEVMERALTANGRAVHVVNSSGWTMQITDALRGIDPLVMHHQPHVVVIGFGLLECQTLTMPTWLFRWLFRGNPRGGVNLWLRERAGRSLITLYKRLTPIVLDRVPLPKRVSPRRFEDELTCLVDNIRKERMADVFLLTVGPPSERIEETLRDIRAGIASYNDIIRRVAASFGDGVQLVEIEPLAASIGVERAMPDGMHFSVEGHRVVGEHLASLVEQAVTDQPAVT